MSQACCIPHETLGFVCEDLDLCECLTQRSGGKPMGTGSLCEHYEDVNGNFQACEFEACCTYRSDGSFIQCDEGFPWNCGDNQFARPGGPGSTCERQQCISPTHGACCHIDGTCTMEASFNDCFTTWGSQNYTQGMFCNSALDCSPNMACCLPNANCIDIPEKQCCELLGQPQGTDTTCENSGHLCWEVLPPGCREAEDDREPEGRRGWTADLCVTTVFGLAVRPDGTGAIEPRTIEPIRAMELTGNEYNKMEEPCGYHYGHMTLTDGKGTIAFCTQPVSQVSDSIQGSYTALVMQEGKGSFVGAYRTPWHQEIQYHSAQYPCGGIIV